MGREGILRGNSPCPSMMMRKSKSHNRPTNLTVVKRKIITRSQVLEFFLKILGMSKSVFFLKCNFKRVYFSQFGIIGPLLWNNYTFPVLFKPFIKNNFIWRHPHVVFMTYSYNYSIKKQILTTDPFELNNSSLFYQYGCIELRIIALISKASYPTPDNPFFIVSP